MVRRCFRLATENRNISGHPARRPSTEKSTSKPPGCVCERNTSPRPRRQQQDKDFTEVYNGDAIMKNHRKKAQCSLDSITPTRDNFPKKCLNLVQVCDCWNCGCADQVLLKLVQRLASLRSNSTGSASNKPKNFCKGKKKKKNQPKCSEIDCTDTETAI